MEPLARTIAKGELSHFEDGSTESTGCRVPEA